MNIQEYIASGVLDLYVMGALTEEENSQVEALAMEHPEIRVEIDEIQRALELLATADDRNPRPELRALIMEDIDGGMDELPAEPPARMPAPVHSIAPTAPSRGRSYLLAASLFLTIVTSGTAAYFAYRWQRAEHELAGVQAESRQYAQGFDALKARYDKVTTDLAVMQDAANRAVTMRGLPTAPNALAVVYWNPETKDVYLDVRDLPTPPADRQYQLWAIAGGKPVDAGVFDLAAGAEGLQRMKPIGSAEAFAVTLEPRGGSASPTLDAMYAQGKL